VIFKSRIKVVAEQHLRLTLATVPSAVTALTHESIFERWLDLMLTRCNELDKIGYIPSSWALDRFIEDAVTAYARVQLERMGQHSVLIESQKPNESDSIQSV
jgi:hypothetical protein